MSVSPRPPKSVPKPVALPRLLLVEDDEPLREALVRMLERRFDVTALADGASAAERVKGDRFDVVLSDIHLRGMNGIDLLRLVRSADLDVPVILMTGLPDVDSAIEAMDLGALTYIKKPFDVAVLDAALERAAKLAALARAKREAIDAGLGGSHASNEHAALTTSFDRALDSMWIAFQPIVDGRSRKTVGFEALMRSNEPTMPTPGAVLDAAERLGRIHDVGRCVRERTAAAFESADDSALVFVNLHAADLLDDDLFDASAPLTKLAKRVVLEITERAAISDISDARHRTAELRRRGFKIAIDDLGAGYAGLTSFATFEPEIVKLDMSLVRGIESSTVKRLIVGRIAGLCRDLEMGVVAEGIETPEELSCMLDLGCEYLQGFLLGRPDEARRPSAYPW
ncbi:MAG: EAL domain-containing response regulator [Labilithrix sp.]|nr:EAL domain-containing response regulator [Labilithrix sp.]MBX3223536.1 EAL domain-containing response regulator [Labilithrix sp.]